MTQITPQSGIMDIALYVSGESNLAGHDDVLKLSSNENPLGFSAAAKSAMIGTIDSLNRYPSTDHSALRHAIGEIHGLDRDRIICGVGSDEVLQFVTHCYAGNDDEIITTEHGFSMYPILARMVGAIPVTVAEKERRIDVDAIIAAVTDRTKIIFIANPANPTGTMLDEVELQRLVDGLPAQVILVLDAAYVEFAAGGHDVAVSLVNRHPNVIMTRTFSKIYGLGGLRIGWGYAAREIIDVLNRVRQPFNLSPLQLAGGEAAVRDTEFTARCAAENAQWREWMRNAFVQMGIGCDESFANFLLARFSSAEEADAADTALRNAGILVRKVGGYGFPAALRITVGDDAGCRRVVSCLSEFMHSRRGTE